MNVGHRTQCNRAAQGAEVGTIHTPNSERWLSVYSSNSGLAQIERFF